LNRARSDESGTWHYGLLARWWAEFNVAEPPELAYWRGAIRRFGEPAIDLGCGTGRFLVPLRSEGFDIDGSDVSEDMLAQARSQASGLDSPPGLFAQPLHELELQRPYRTMFMCGVFGIGGRRDLDREALRRARRHLEPGGALLIIQVLPNNEGHDVQSWAEWLPGHHPVLPEPWPQTGNRRRCADGDELELRSRTVTFDSLQQLEVMEIQARLWHEGEIVREEEYRLRACLYFPQEIVLLLHDAGFADVVIEGNYTNEPALQDEGTVIFVAR
jgi:SAM-dependent methyltransferase